MTWPAGSIPTTNLDAGTDSPGSARADLKTAVDQLNAAIAARGAASGVASLDSSTKIPIAQLPTTFIANGVQSYIAAGSYSWTVPAGIYRLRVRCWGAGGGGGFGVDPTAHGGGGGGAGMAYKVWTVSPGDSVSVVVGAGGAGGVGPANAAGTAGANSTVTIGGVSITGQGGGAGGAGPGGIGGTPGGATGADLHVSGGSGQTGIAGMGGQGGSGAQGCGSAPFASSCATMGGGGYGAGTGVAAGTAGGDGTVIIEY